MPCMPTAKALLLEADDHEKQLKFMSHEPRQEAVTLGQSKQNFIK